MDSKDSFPKTVLPLVCLRNLPAVAPQQQGRLLPLGRRQGRQAAMTASDGKLSSATRMPGRVRVSASLHNLPLRLAGCELGVGVKEPEPASHESDSDSQSGFRGTVAPGQLDDVTVTP